MLRLFHSFKAFYRFESFSINGSDPWLHIRVPWTELWVDDELPTIHLNANYYDNTLTSLSHY